VANTTDHDDENYGLLLEFKSMRGGSKRYVLPRALLMGLDCTEAARILASMGLRIPAGNRKEWRACSCSLTSSACAAGSHQTTPGPSA
jgi:hypothetical protein